MPDDLSRCVALAIEPEPTTLIPKDGTPCWRRVPYWPDDPNSKPVEPRSFATDRNLLPMILAEVERREKAREFMDALDDQIQWKGRSAEHEKVWRCGFGYLNATPEQICRSFLAAVGGK